MAIYELNDTEVRQRCSKCGVESRIALDALEVGASRGVQIDGRLVPLPACPGCRSTEWLVRSADDETPHPAPGSSGHLHRLLVDQVHAELVKRLRVVPELKQDGGRPLEGLARPVAAADVKRWFPAGFRIQLPEPEVSPPK